MDILIKNMEMPKEGSVVIEIYSDGVWCSIKSHLYHGKAIELPPHGDLKDGWVLLGLFERELGSSVIGQRVKNLIVNSPTIVEANDGSNS